MQVECQIKAKYVLSLVVLRKADPPLRGPSTADSVVGAFKNEVYFCESGKVYG
jgi:hypothetical protein